jgi:hypothetical protein
MRTPSRRLHGGERVRVQHHKHDVDVVLRGFMFERR